MRELTEKEISELIYSARTGDLDELKSNLEQLSKELNEPLSEILPKVVDPFSHSTPLHMSCANGCFEIVEYILSSLKGDNGASSTTLAMIQAKNSSGNTALHWACLNGQIEIVKLLCDHDADPFERNNAGQDCIFQAENTEKLDLVDYLLNRYEDQLGGEEIDDNEDNGSIKKEEDGNIEKKVAGIQLN
ncbi:ankyrin repeat-containing domain protein [Dipodascopsis uninucleata]